MHSQQAWQPQLTLKGELILLPDHSSTSQACAHMRALPATAGCLAAQSSTGLHWGAWGSQACQEAGLHERQRHHKVAWLWWGTQATSAHRSPGWAAARGGEARALVSTTSLWGLRSCSQASPRLAGSGDLNSTSYSRASKLGGSCPGWGCPTQLSTPCTQVHVGGRSPCSTVFAAGAGAGAGQHG